MIEITCIEGGKGHAGTGGKADKKADDKVGDLRAGGNGSHGHRSHKVSHHQAVHAVVEALEQLPDENGKGNRKKL